MNTANNHSFKAQKKCEYCIETDFYVSLFEFLFSHKSLHQKMNQRSVYLQQCLLTAGLCEGGKGLTCMAFKG